jgi:hydrogenase maturation factor HypF (carbamoyltransferase family)
VTVRTLIHLRTSASRTDRTVRRLTQGHPFGLKRVRGFTKEPIAVSAVAFSGTGRAVVRYRAPLGHLTFNVYISDLDVARKTSLVRENAVTMAFLSRKQRAMAFSDCAPL